LKPIKLTLAVSLAAALSGCATLLSPNGPAQQHSAQSVEAEDKDIEYADFNQDDDTLYDLLVAEIAAQRGQLNITLLNYIQQAKHTRDPSVIRRAINAAQFSKDALALKELGLLWVEVEPGNASAHQLMAFQYSIEKQYSDAIHHIDKVLELGGNISIESLAIGSQSLPEEDKQELLALYQKLQTKHPKSKPVRYSLAIVHSNLEQYDQALGLLDALIDEDEYFQAAYVLKANVLFEQQNKEATFDFVEDAYERFPKNHALGRLYASLLIEQKRLDDAEEIFANLMAYYPKSPSFKLSHALVMLENQKRDEAKQALEALLEMGAHKNEAHFYLGRIEDQQGNKDAAIAHYLQIGQSIHFESSLERAAYLLMNDERFDEALEALSNAREKYPGEATIIWSLEFRLLNSFQKKTLAMQSLNDAITEFPESEQLLYARAMMHDADKDMTAMEADLRRILTINPQNAIAMNALGYTLADKTERYDEALQLISNALKLKPENAAIMDSMGWVLFKLGRNEESLAFLLNAFQRFSDGEVGAHLGEVLLSLGQTTEAKEVWSKALELNPSHPVLLETLQRLAPDLIPSAPTQEQAPVNDSAESAEPAPVAKNADSTQTTTQE